jgi:hypothetical protein
MKKNVCLFLVAAFAAVVSFSSCSKDNDQPVTGDAVLVVKLPGAATSRAVGTPLTGTQETAITATNSLIFLLNGTSVYSIPQDGPTPAQSPYVITAADLNSNEAEVRFEQVPGSIDNVIVVANIPAANLTAVKGLTTAAAIKNYAYSIADQNPAVDNGIVGKTLIGEGTVTSGIDPDAGNHTGHDFKEASVHLKAITSRIEIGAVKAGSGVANIELIGVWINNYYLNNSTAKTGAPVNHASGNSVWTIASPATGTATTAYTNPTTIPAYTATQYYNAADNTNVKLDAGSKSYNFQLFPGAVAAAGVYQLPRIVLLVKGMFDTGAYVETGIPTNDLKYFLKFVTIGGYEISGTPVTQFLPNTIYKIGLGTVGITIKAENLTDIPEVAKSDILVSVEVDPWTLQVLDPVLE